MPRIAYAGIPSTSSPTKGEERAVKPLACLRGSAQKALERILEDDGPGTYATT